MQKCVLFQSKVISFICKFIQRIHIEFWWGNFLEGGGREEQVVLRCILSKYIVRFGGGWKWFRIILVGFIIVPVV